MIMQKTITGLFDSRAAAERTVEYLVQEHHVPREAVKVHAAGTANVTAGSDDQRSEAHHGFVPSAGQPAGGREVGLPEPVRQMLGRSLSRAGIVVIAIVPASQREDALRAFTDNGAVEVATTDGRLAP